MTEQNHKPIVLKKISELKPYGKNAKKHTDEQVQKIVNSIQEFGFRRFIEITPDNVIVNGHGRVLACQKLGMKTIPCVVLDDMSEVEIKAYRLADNKTNEGGYDSDLLSAELYDLTAGGEVDMGQFFDAKELAFVMDDIGIDDAAISENLAEEVGEIADSTNGLIEEEEGKRIKIENVLGFKDVSAAQQRTIRKLMDYIEATTKSTGADALTQFAHDFVGL